ncbi:MAG: hypothetical protein JRN15_05455 [Nitrososphaerota archaeon]|nr:hypothetical protein [Nitrososphaerota archaeon]
MAALNLVLMVLFGRGFWDVWRSKLRGLYLMIILCLFDISAEFLFHGLVLITVSVLVAAVMICFAILEIKKNKIM